MNRKIIPVIALELLLGFFAVGQTQQGKEPQAAGVQPGSGLAHAMAQRLGNDLHVKTILGEPIKVGSVTLIPVLMVEVTFSGGRITAPASSAAGSPQSPPPGADGFFMSGEARPLGFVVVTKKGVRFISAVKTLKK